MKSFKSLIPYFFAFILFFIFACDEEILQSNDDVVPVTEITDYQNEILNIGDYQERKLAYLSSPTSVKSAIWLRKINDVQTYNWSTDQQVYFNLLKDQITPELFAEGSIENVIFKEQFISNWLGNALRYFEFEELKLVLLTIDLIDFSNGFREIVAPWEAYDEEDCECSESSDWCGSSECYGRCTQAHWGCGTLFLFECDGVCMPGQNNGG